MQELQIPNGYFQLWNMYLIEQGIDFHQLGFLAQYQYELEHVLQLPIDTQSPFSFYWPAQLQSFHQLNSSAAFTTVGYWQSLPSLRLRFVFHD
jgi:hypothetical protein